MRASQALARPWRRGCAQSPSAMRRSARCAPAVMYAEALFTPRPHQLMFEGFSCRCEISQCLLLQLAALCARCAPAATYAEALCTPGPHQPSGFEKRSHLFMQM